METILPYYATRTYDVCRKLLLHAERSVQNGYCFFFIAGCVCLQIISAMLLSISIRLQTYDHSQRQLYLQSISSNNKAACVRDIVSHGERRSWTMHPPTALARVREWREDSRAMVRTAIPSTRRAGARPGTRLLLHPRSSIRCNLEKGYREGPGGNVKRPSVWSWAKVWRQRPKGSLVPAADRN